jgi:hypothetical protein
MQLFDSPPILFPLKLEINSRPSVKSIEFRINEIKTNKNLITKFIDKTIT